MLDQFFINVGHLGKFSSQNIKMHVYEHRQAADRRDYNLLRIVKFSVFLLIISRFSSGAGTASWAQISS